MDRQKGLLICRNYVRTICKDVIESSRNDVIVRVYKQTGEDSQQVGGTCGVTYRTCFERVQNKHAEILNRSKRTKSKPNALPEMETQRDG